MKYFILDEEEQQLLEEFERGEWKRIKNFKQEKKRFQAIVRNTLNKKRNINIRLSEKDLRKLKVKAAEDGFLTRLWLVQFFTSLPTVRKALVCNLAI